MIKKGKIKPSTNLILEQDNLRLASSRKDDSSLIEVKTTSTLDQIKVSKNISKTRQTQKSIQKPMERITSSIVFTNDLKSNMMKLMLVMRKLSSNKLTSSV